MKYQDIQDRLSKQMRLMFNYKERYYSLQKVRRRFKVTYVLYDTDMPQQREKTLTALYHRAKMYDGRYLCEIVDKAVICEESDQLGLSYEAIRHEVIIYNREVLFLYHQKYYWIAHTSKGEAHLSDEYGNTQFFLSARDLFDYARIDNKKLSGIWNEVTVDTC